MTAHDFGFNSLYLNRVKINELTRLHLYASPHAPLISVSHLLRKAPFCSAQFVFSRTTQIEGKCTGSLTYY